MHSGIRIHLKVIRLQCGVRSNEITAPLKMKVRSYTWFSTLGGWECDIEPALGRNQDFGGSIADAIGWLISLSRGEHNIGCMNRNFRE